MTYVLNTEFPEQATVDGVLAAAKMAEAKVKELAETRKAIGDAASGKAADRAQEEIAEQERVFAQAANSARLAHAALVEWRLAGEKYRRDSPTIEDRTAAETDTRAKTKRMQETARALESAEQVLSSARGMLMGASNEGRAQAERNVAVAETARDTAKVADDKAAAEFRVAKAHLADINRRMRTAEEAYTREMARVTAGVPTNVGGNGLGVGSPGGSGVGATDPGASTAGAPSKPGGPSKPAPASAVAPATAPAAKPSAGTPSGTAKPVASAAPAAKTTGAGSKSSSDEALASVLANLRAQGQTSQTGQGAGQAAPVSASPSTGAGTGKPGQGQDDDGKGGQGGGSGRPWDLPDVAAAVGTSVDWLNGKSTPAPAPTTTPAPAAPAANPAARLAGGMPITPTSGTSVTGVATSQDVSGRSGPTPGGYSPAPATSTSAAHGGGTGTSAAGSQAGRAGVGTGMPIMPMMPGAGGGGAGGTSAQRKQVQRFRTSDEVDILNGELTLAETVGGYGTLCWKGDRD